MAEVIRKGIFQQGKLEEKIRDTLRLLQLRFGEIPNEIVDELNSRTDMIALDSLFDLAAQCNTWNDFAKALK